MWRKNANFRALKVGERSEPSEGLGRKKGRPPPPLSLLSPLLRAFHKLLGNFLATARISSNFFVSINFLHSHFEKFLYLSSNSEILEQLLVLRLAFLPYFTNVLVDNLRISCKKKSQILTAPPSTDRSWAQDESSRAARSAVYRENSKWRTKIHTVSIRSHLP